MYGIIFRSANNPVVTQCSCDRFINVMNIDGESFGVTIAATVGYLNGNIVALGFLIINIGAVLYA